MFRPSQATFYLKYTNTQGNADTQFPYGDGSMLPVAGVWGDIPAIPPLTLEPVATGLDAPMLATAPIGDYRLFVPERGGAIRIIENGTVNPTPFLTLGGVSQCGEGGLLGLAFHPDYASNGRFFVHYTASRGHESDLESRSCRVPRITVVGHGGSESGAHDPHARPTEMQPQRRVDLFRHRRLPLRPLR